MIARFWSRLWKLISGFGFARPRQQAGPGINLNVDGRQLSSPLRGFGQMWQKTYRIRLEGASVDPQDLVKAWKENFPQFWPEGNRFYGRVAQVQALIRDNDPLYEISFRLGFGHRMEDAFWQQTLRNLAAHFGAHGNVTQEVVLVDPRVQWSQAGNLWHNAAIRTGMYLALAPVRWVKGIFKRET